MEWIFDQNYQEADFLYQDFSEEEERIIEISHAVEKLNDDAQFSFYDLTLTNHEKDTLSQLNINTYSNIVVFSSQVDNLKDHIGCSIDQSMELNSNTVDVLSLMISRLVSNILSVTGYENVEMILRSEKQYNIDESSISNQCIYWHIDKSHGEIAESTDVAGHLIGREKEQKLFIISLVGETTLYYHATNEQRQEFMSFANETAFFYGHNLPENCVDGDKINLLFDHEKIKSAQAGYGSVHIAGKQGSIHAAPVCSDHGRLILLITPI